VEYKRLTKIGVKVNYEEKQVSEEELP